MADDLVHLLRKYQPYNTLHGRAADELERLRVIGDALARAVDALTAGMEHSLAADRALIDAWREARHPTEPAPPHADTTMDAASDHTIRQATSWWPDTPPQRGSGPDQLYADVAVWQTIAGDLVDHITHDIGCTWAKSGCDCGMDNAEAAYFQASTTTSEHQKGGPHGQR